MDNKEKSKKITEIYRKALEKINQLRHSQVQTIQKMKIKK